jgi:hypothetical protein
MPLSAQTVSASQTPEQPLVVISRSTVHRLLFEFSNSWWNAEKSMRKHLLRQLSGIDC